MRVTNFASITVRRYNLWPCREIQITMRLLHSFHILPCYRTVQLVGFSLVFMCTLNLSKCLFVRRAVVQFRQLPLCQTAGKGQWRSGVHLLLIEAGSRIQSRAEVTCSNRSRGLLLEVLWGKTVGDDLTLSLTLNLTLSLTLTV